MSSTTSEKSSTSAQMTTAVLTTQRKQQWLLVLLALVLLAVADYWLYPQLSPIGGQSLNRGENGSWLRYTWYFGEEKEQVVKLARRLQQQQVKFAYFHVRFIKKDGSLRFHYEHNARHLTKAMRAAAPDTKNIAWIYVGNERGLTGVNIADIKVRRKMVNEALWLVQKCGFDGIQWDYEICESGNGALLDLLSETRARLPHDKILSIATPMWLPAPLGGWGWSEDYFTQIAAHCDQIAVMAYDSALYFPRHYVRLVHQQVARISRAAARGDANCGVLIGIPTYEDGGPSHHLHSETITMALKGVREGADDPQTNTRALRGVAIFADYSTDDAERKVYNRLWLQK